MLPEAISALSRRIKDVNLLVMERDMYPPIKKWCKDKYYMIEEVLMRHRKIDLLLIDRETRKTFVAMEFKLRDFEKAFIQSLSYLLVANYSYVVFYKKHAGRVDEGLLREHGIGLILATGRDSEIKIKATRNDKLLDDVMIALVLKNKQVKAIVNGFTR
jgi:hypothetical protein